MPVPPGFDRDPRPEGLLRRPDPVATRNGWQAIIRAAVGRVDPAPARAHPGGHPVPADYLELVAEHGPGAYAGLAVAPAADLPALGARVAERHRWLRGGERFIPAHLHPEPGGLIPWAELPGGDACCWYPAGRDPGSWPVVVCSRDGAGWQRYDLSTTAFVCEWLAGRVRPAYRTTPQAPLAERLDRLAEVLGAGDARWVVDWRAVEAELGVGLPADYRAFVERFGAGSVNQELYIVVPSAPLPRFDLIAGNAGRAKARRLLHQESSQYRADSPCPPPGWLLVWGKTNTRASLYWRTDGPNPDAWPVVLYDEVDWIDCGRGFLCAPQHDQADRAMLLKATDAGRLVTDRARHKDAALPWLWLGLKGLTAWGIVLMLRRRGREVGLPDLHPHQFRHTFAHQWLADGGGETDLMRLAGWKSRLMLQRYGASAADARAREAHRRQSPAGRL
jgi:hypothetical protein